jgi:hypothetical protein
MVTYAILQSKIGFEKRVKVPNGFSASVFRYPIKQEYISIFERPEGGVVEMKQKSFETVDFEYRGKQETDNAVYIYYAEVERQA